MPDKETDPSIGTKCMIIDYSRPKLNLNSDDYFSQPFCQKFRLQEPLKQLSERLDILVSRYKKKY